MFTKGIKGNTHIRGTYEGNNNKNINIHQKRIKKKHVEIIDICRKQGTYLYSYLFHTTNVVAITCLINNCKCSANV